MKRIQTRLLLVMALVAAVFTQLPRAVDHQTGAAFAAATGGDAVTVWNANAGVAATAACLAPLGNPLHESRIYAMMHVAIHDALNAIDRRSRPVRPRCCRRKRALLRMPPLLRPHEMCWSRSSLNCLSSFTRRLAGMQA